MKKKALSADYLKKAETLRKYNIGAFALHGLSFIAALTVAIIFASGSFLAELTVDFRIYDLLVPNAFITESRSLGFYQLIWLELPFPLITSFFHALIAFYEPIRTRYTFLALQREANPLRWLEYSITASFMTWVILQLSGVTNVFLLVLVGVVCNVALQTQGYFMELVNPPQRKRTNWIPTILGWIIFMGQWAVIISYFLAAITSPRPPGSENPPWFVYTIVFGLFFQFATFGLVQLLHFLGWPAFLKSGYGVELAFVILSFVSKFSLDWILLIGIATNQMTP